MRDRRYTDPDFAMVSLITISLQRDVLDRGPLETTRNLDALRALLLAEPGGPDGQSGIPVCLRPGGVRPDPR